MIEVEWAADIGDETAHWSSLNGGWSNLIGRPVAAEFRSGDRVDLAFGCHFGVTLLTEWQSWTEGQSLWFVCSPRKHVKNPEGGSLKKRVKKKKITDHHH